MTQNSSNLVVVLLLFTLLIDATNGVGAALAGQWEPIKNLNDPHVVEIAKFAVSEYDNRSKAMLTFVVVVSGQTQVVSGTNYKLVVTAKNGSGSSGNYEAIVWEKASLSKELVSFKRL